MFRSFMQPWSRSAALRSSQSLIASIQRGVISLNNLTTANATINPVNLASSIIIYGGVQAAGGSGNPSIAHCKVVLADATTVTATVVTANANTRNVEYTVIEFMPGVIRSIQQGTITVAGAAVSNTATITEVNPAKSLCFHDGFTTDYAGALSDASLNSRMSLTNGTTVTFYNATASDNRVGSYVVVEFF